MSRAFALVMRVAWPVPIFSTKILRRFSQGCIKARYSPFGESEYDTFTGFRKKSFSGTSGGNAVFVGAFFCAKAEKGKSSKRASSSTGALVFIHVSRVKEIAGGLSSTLMAINWCATYRWNQKIR